MTPNAPRRDLNVGENQQLPFPALRRRLSAPRLTIPRSVGGRSCAVADRTAKIHTRLVSAAGWGIRRGVLTGSHGSGKERDGLGWIGTFGDGKGRIGTQRDKIAIMLPDVWDGGSGAVWQQSVWRETLQKACHSFSDVIRISVMTM